MLGGLREVSMDADRRTFLWLACAGVWGLCAARARAAPAAATPAAGDLVRVTLDVEGMH
jgi:hypothetical protein